MIRPVRLDDAAAVAAIYNPYVMSTTVSFETAALSPAGMGERIAALVDAGYPYYVWVDDEGVVRGYCYAHPWKERAAYSRTWETTIYLAPDCCRGGIGKGLMEVLVEECRRRGCHVLIACVTAENEASVRFHERIGFERVSHFKEVGYKRGHWLDVIDLQLTLSQQL